MRTRNYDRMDAATLAHKVRVSRTFRNLLRQYKLGERKVLDVGSSDGHYLRHFGPGSKGVTIIKEHVERAQAEGLSVMWGNVEEPMFSTGEKFDVLWVNNLLEHLNAPHSFLVRMREELEEGGTLILGVPVIPFPSFLTKLRKFRGAYAVSHVNFFTRRTLIDTARAAGWKVEDARLFFMRSQLLDLPFTIIAPHMYVVATPNPHFGYAEKRLRSLEGYT